GDDGLVRVSLQERDDHFLPDAGDRHAAPALAGPGLRHPQPARAVLVPLALAIPEELHLHPAVLVDVDLLAAGADHRGRLHAVDHRTRRVARGAEVDGGLDALEVVLVRHSAGLALPVGLAGMMADARHDVAAVEGGRDTLTHRLEGKLVPGRERAGVAAAA